ncbi:MAG: ABC transporter substrate-binding protein [Bacteroidota bacterium]
MSRIAPHSRASVLTGLLAAGLVLAACGPAEQSNVPAGEPDGTPIPMDYTQTFSVTELDDGIRVVDMRASVTSWGGAADGPEQRARIALIPREIEMPALTGPLAGSTVVRTPVERVATNFAPFEAALTALGVADRLVAVGGTTSYDDAIHARVVAGELAQIGYGWHMPPILDALAAAEADVMLMALADLSYAESIPRIEALGTPVVPTFMAAEPHYLGRVDYVRLVGMLTGHEAKADSFVTMVHEEVDRLKTLAASQPQKSVLFAWYSGGDRWGVTVRNDDAQLLRDANAEVVLSEPDDARLDAMAFLGTEHLLADATEADCWVIQESGTEMYRDEGVLERFRAWQEGCVYGATLQSKPRRNAWEIFEAGVIRPDYMLGDIVKMLHPEVRPEPFRYLAPVGPTAGTAHVTP